MLSLNTIAIPNPKNIIREDDAFVFKVPLKPYVVIRDNKKYLYRWEQWGVIEYDYQLDQFSAMVNPSAEQTELISIQA